jgi:hypothetical protein
LKARSASSSRPACSADNPRRNSSVSETFAGNYFPDLVELSAFAGPFQATAADADL